MPPRCESKPYCRLYVVCYCNSSQGSEKCLVFCFVSFAPRAMATHPSFLRLSGMCHSRDVVSLSRPRDDNIIVMIYVCSLLKVKVITVVVRILKGPSNPRLSLVSCSEFPSFRPVLLVGNEPKPVCQGFKHSYLHPQRDKAPVTGLSMACILKYFDKWLCRLEAILTWMQLTQF